MIRKKDTTRYGIILLVSIFLIGNVLGAVSYCCERTDYGAWCQNDEQSSCDTSYQISPTECSSTSYCKPGTCINKIDGECMENTPQRNCDSSLGNWVDANVEDIPQCNLGCCFIGEQAAFVTQAKCKSFASLYAIDTSFQSNIQDEFSCIASAFPDVEGACVYEEEFSTTCKRTTRKECEVVNDATFHEGFLCTSEDLATDCAVTSETTCVEGRDEIFFLDSCGNIANIYDSSKITEIDNQAVTPSGEENYWTYIIEADCGEGNANSPSCGNCDYFEGSTCKEYDRNKHSNEPDYGDYICENLGCSYDNDIDGVEEAYLHGETWCADINGATVIEVGDGEVQTTSLDSSKTSLPGSRYYRLVCYNGEVTAEPCEDYRAEICIQEETPYIDENNNDRTFKSAVCRVNA
ncbi:MAG: hypothetical protein OQK82_01960, partial [Candidatus Pacearchaeota archaeon]|nr:hypothetical protein [Candidatus Pacearchaeota archaeon]